MNKKVCEEGVMKNFFYYSIIITTFLTNNMHAMLTFKVSNTTIIIGKNGEEYVGQATCKKMLPDSKNKAVIINFTWNDTYIDKVEIRKSFTEKVREQMKLEGYSFPLVCKNTS